MVPSVIVEITWHSPGGRYHSPSIITAHCGRCHSYQRRNQRRPRKWPMDILLRCSAGVSTRRERPPFVSDVYRPTDLPGCVPPERCGLVVSVAIFARSLRAHRTDVAGGPDWPRMQWAAIWISRSARGWTTTWYVIDQRWSGGDPFRAHRTRHPSVCPRLDRAKRCSP